MYPKWAMCLCGCKSPLLDAGAVGRVIDHELRSCVGADVHDMQLRQTERYYIAAEGGRGPNMWVALSLDSASRLLMIRALFLAVMPSA